MNQSIVINREYGSGGREIGKLVAEKLHMPLFDSNILTEVVEKKGFRHDILETFDEKIVGSVLYNLSLLNFMDQESINQPYEMYSAIADTMVDSARKEPCIFIGRCADKILQDANIPCLNVFIYSNDFEAKKKRAKEVDGIEPIKVENYIHKKDKARREYQHFFAHTKFGDYKAYDLCLNSGVFGYELCSELIMHAMKEKDNRIKTNK